MAAQNGAAPATNSVNEGRVDALGTSTPDSRSHINPQTFYVTDGRIPIGTVEVIGGSYVAVNADGQVIGRFGTLRLATRALPAGRAP